MPLLEGEARLAPGALPYAPQLAQLFLGSLRENVLFGLRFHPDAYAEVLRKNNT